MAKFMPTIFLNIVTVQNQNLIQQIKFVGEDTSTVNASCKNIVINPEFREQIT
jgi:hypothetical protein